MIDRLRSCPWPAIAVYLTTATGMAALLGFVLAWVVTQQTTSQREAYHSGLLIGLSTTLLIYKYKRYRSADTALKRAVRQTRVWLATWRYPMEDDDHSLHSDERALGLIGVFLWFLTLLFSLWIFWLMVGHVLEPIRDIVMGMEVVQSSGYDSGLERLWPVLVIFAPLLLLVGGICLIIIYAVWRERFLGGRRVPR